MIPQVAKLLSLDVYRDGGSLSVSFADNNGTQHELGFLIEHTEDQKEPLKKYQSAIIESFLKSEYVSPVTGIATEKTNIKKNTIAWSEAASLLKKIKPLVKDFQSEYIWVFESMSIIVSNDSHEIKYS